jgi:hypothetical protein
MSTKGETEVRIIPCRHCKRKLRLTILMAQIECVLEVSCPICKQVFRVRFHAKKSQEKDFDPAAVLADILREAINDASRRPHCHGDKQ